VGKNHLALRRKRGFADAKSTTSCTFVLSVLMSCSGNRVACELILVETRCLDPTYFLRFVQDAFSEACFLFDLRGEAICFVSCKTRSARLLFFRPHGRGNTFRFVQDAFSEACFLFDLNDEAIRSFPFLFSLTDYPGEGPPYQLR
jgi:hypothetical protein